MTDDELVDCLRSGDREAFCTVVEKYAKPITMMILRMVKDQEDALDISQQVFLKAYENIPFFLKGSSLKTWLYKIAVNAVRDHFRKPKVTFVRDGLDDLADTSKSPDERLEHEQEMLRIRRAVESLPEKQRMTLQLRVYEGLDYGQISTILGGRSGAARGNLFQAVKTLRQKLEENK